MKTIPTLVIFVFIFIILYQHISHIGEASLHYKEGIIAGIGIGKMVYEESEIQDSARAIYSQEVAEAEKLFVNPNSLVVMPGHHEINMDVNVPANIELELK